MFYCGQGHLDENKFIQNPYFRQEHYFLGYWQNESLFMQQAHDSNSKKVYPFVCIPTNVWSFLFCQDFEHQPNVTLTTLIYQIRCVYGICGWTNLKSELKVPRTSFVAMLVPDDLTSCNQTFVPWKKQNPALFRRLDALFLPLSCKFHSVVCELF